MNPKIWECLWECEKGRFAAIWIKPQNEILLGDQQKT